MVASRPSGKAPPFQLVEGDRFNLCLGLCAAFSLAACKHLPAKHCTPFLRWQLNAYTNWNLAFIAIRYAMNQRQWEPFLLVNSLGIVSGFRTAFSQGLDENMRKKLAPMFRSEFGIDLPRWLFVTLDHLVHTLPAAVLSASILTRRRSVHPMNSVYVLMLYTWFSFRQSSTLDVSNIYVPHPWKRAWAGVLTALFVTPSLVSTPRVLGYAHHASCRKLRFFACAFPYTYACVLVGAFSQVDAINSRRPSAIVLRSIIMLLPWLSAKLDPTLRKTYNFECMLAASHRASQQQQITSGPSADGAQKQRPGGLTIGLNHAYHVNGNQSTSEPPSPLHPFVLKRGATADSASFRQMLKAVDEAAPLKEVTKLVAERSMLAPYPIGQPL